MGSKVAWASMPDRDAIEENAACARPCSLSDMYVEMMAFEAGLMRPLKPSITVAVKNMWTLVKKARNMKATAMPTRPIRMTRKSEHLNLSFKIWKKEEQRVMRKRARAHNQDSLN